MRAPLRAGWRGALAAAAFACAGVDPHGLPVCSAEKPSPEPSCELGADVVDWKRDAVLTLWGYVGSQLRRLPVSVDFDAAARVEAVCLAPDASVPRPQRKNVARGMRALESMRRTPSCLAGRRLALGEAWAEQARGSGNRRSRDPEPEHRCSIRDPGCDSFGPPVCALRSNGRRVEFRDRCEACRDPNVVGYDDYPCF
jgi:hypothetical protein